MDKEPSIKKNYVLNLSYQVLAVIVPLITTPYVSRVLQADGIGEYSYALSIVTYFSMIAALGVATYGQLEVAKLRYNTIERSKVFWEINLARLITTFLMIVVYEIMEPFLATNAVLYQIMLINLVAGALDISWFFQGLEEFKVTVFRNFIIKILSTVCIFAFVRSKTDLGLYACILQGSTLIGNVLLWPYLKKYLCVINIKDIKFHRHWKSSLIYFIPTVATSVYTVLDKSMIGLITKSSFENGYYEQAHKIEQILIVVLTSLGTVTLPRLAYLWDNGDKEAIGKMLKNTTDFILFLSFPMMFGLIATADKLIPVFLGNGYEPCVKMLKIFAVLLVVVGLDNTIGKQCLVATGRQNLFNRGVIVGAIVNFVCNIPLIIFLGATGAAIGSVLAECTILFIFIFYSRDVLNVRGTVKGGLRYCCLGLIMGLVTWTAGLCLPISIMGLIVQIMVGIVTYLLLLLITKDQYLMQAINVVKHKLQ